MSISQVYGAIIVFWLVLISNRHLLAFTPYDLNGELSVDEATRQCQVDCVNDPLLYECDEECSTRYPDERNMGICLLYCTRAVQQCLRRCANIEKYKKQQELLDRLLNRTGDRLSKF